ncbi:hypothetical protein QN355_06540 [Cryobacterium sp. 10S3]|uniref:hypothetical protein n=1 Tax=Cryobacterium sp. 10S3 TaxID=3048582 RepID=UPI002AC9B8D5|nr:hypothetical protein [Cryobacterium sp. 10S3]MEB0286206.1 hypothetical protein [Cryobacterium sp. 10S3]WPX12264.1 hypothetical protein RHM57_11280 [Cryobacterium sp. 10S3]
MDARESREFMWQFQHIFRHHSEELVNKALLAIGLPAAPEVLLVGFRESGNYPHQICVEPEDGEFRSSLFIAAMSEAERAFASDPLREILVSNARLQQQRTERSRENARREALKAALHASPRGSDRYFFPGYAGRVGNYRIYPVVTVLRSRWDTAPSLPDEIDPTVPRTDHLSYAQSLQHAVVRAALGEMTLALALSPEPEGLRTWASDLVGESVRQATNNFVRGIVVRFGNEYGGDLFNAMNAVSAQPYEGRTGVGTLLMSKSDAKGIDADVAFKTRIPVSETRALRKALEMTGPDLALLTDGSHARGLGHLHDSTATGNHIEITVTGRGQWALGIPDMALLAVENGTASLPRDRINRTKFLDTVDRVFGGAGDGAALWALTEAAVQQQHGTMLVVHADAEAEAERLAPQALAITPRALSQHSLSSLSAIDGAILVTPDAQCHAVGVILDGRAVAGVGDASRGARYNSALRYHQGAHDGTTMIVIVSEDGMINLLPNLHRRISRVSVAQAVDDLHGASEPPVDFERAWKRAARVRSIAFYLSEEQTAAANAAFEAVEKAREKATLASGRPGITRVGYDLLVTDPRMNDSYFLD